VLAVDQRCADCWRGRVPAVERLLTLEQLPAREVADCGAADDEGSC
jgi:hypothetical protein